MLDLNRLRVLVAVARTGSVTAAADELHYAQPSVSHHLARLEAEAGVPLLERAGRGVRLTEAGRVLVDRAEEILGQVASAQAELDAHAGLTAGRLRVAAFPSAVASLVPQAARTFATQHPEVELALTEAEPPEALTLLRHGEVDVALIFAHGEVPASDRRDTTLTTLVDEPMYLVTRAGSPLQGAGSDLADYADASWIAGCERCRAHLIESCQAVGFAPRIGFETDDYVAVQALVSAGLGVSTLPGLALLAHRHPGVRVDALPDRRTVFVVTYGRSAPALPVQAFTAALQENAVTPDWPSA